MSGGECQTGNIKDYEGEEDEAPTQALDDADIELLKSYGRGPYTDTIKETEDQIKKHQDKVRYLLSVYCMRLCMCIHSGSNFSSSSLPAI
jgi:26S proteasome regulatory subunit T1